MLGIGPRTEAHRLKEGDGRAKSGGTGPAWRAPERQPKGTLSDGRVAAMTRARR
jgi:hypothetical protein